MKRSHSVGSMNTLTVYPGSSPSLFSDTSCDEEVQKQIAREVRMQEGASKLLAACSQREQALEASKSLVTCSARILALLSQLQKMREAQVLQRMGRRSSEVVSFNERLPCMGKVAISDLRIPLMWKDSEYFKNKGELHRCAVFCLVQCGTEIYDTDLVMVDRTLTDICFEETIFSNEVGPGFQLRVELYSSCVPEDFSLGAPAPRRLSRLGGSLGCTTRKKTRAALKSAVNHLYHVQDSFKTHDLSLAAAEDSPFWLPLYGNMCCRLVAQPLCMVQQIITGKLMVKLGEDLNCWDNAYGVLRGTSLFCYHSQDDFESDKQPLLTIPINKVKREPLQAQSIHISTQCLGEDATYTLTTHTPDDTQRWMEAFWQHFYDMSQWKHCCDDLMKIEMPCRRKSITVKQGSLYHEIGNEREPGNHRKCLPLSPELTY
uniref:Rhotekin b n=1 Tax=Myripristis murdjan TaxID=586833 RepID=A0A667ZDK5_9TELE